MPRGRCKQPPPPPLWPTTLLATAVRPSPPTTAVQLVELKNGETYNGHMVQCDTWMNIHLREVICTSKVRSGDDGSEGPRVPAASCGGMLAGQRLCLDWFAGAAAAGVANLHAGPLQLHATSRLFRHPTTQPQDGDRFWRMPEAYIRGNTIKYLRVPDEVLDKAREADMRRDGATLLHALHSLRCYRNFLVLFALGRRTAAATRICYTQHKEVSSLDSWQGRLPQSCGARLLYSCTWAHAYMPSRGWHLPCC